MAMTELPEEWQEMGLRLENDALATHLEVITAVRAQNFRRLEMAEALLRSVLEDEDRSDYNPHCVRITVNVEAAVELMRLALDAIKQTESYS